MNCTEHQSTTNCSDAIVIQDTVMWWWTTSCCSSRGPQWSEDWLLFAGHMLTSWLSTTQFNPLVTMMNTCASRQDININVSGHFTEIHGTIWIYHMRSFPHLSQFIMMFTWQNLYTDGCTFGQELVPTCLISAPWRANSLWHLRGSQQTASSLMHITVHTSCCAF